MSIVDKFGEKVGEIAEKDPVKARKLLLAGYRLQEKRLALFPDRKLPMSGQYVAKIVMNNIIQALAKPENAAKISIFVPGELLTAAGLTPYSVEALSCFIAGTKCEQAFLRQTEKEGFPETMCSYHRVFLGAGLNDDDGKHGNQAARHKHIILRPILSVQIVKRQRQRHLIFIRQHQQRPQIIIPAFHEGWYGQ